MDCLWNLSRCGKVLTFPITSRAKETMQPYITKYTKAGSLYYTPMTGLLVPFYQSVVIMW